MLEGLSAEKRSFQEICDGHCHEMAAELFIRIMAARVSTDTSPQEFSGDVARDCYVYARAFFDEHGRQLGNARSARHA
jgi:hypothetical protein